MNKLDFSFSSFNSFHFYSIFPPGLVVGLSLDLIDVVKVFQETLKKVKFFNKKWQVIGRPDFSSIYQSNLTGFSHVTLAQFTRSITLGTFERFLPSA